MTRGSRHALGLALVAAALLGAGAAGSTRAAEPAWFRIAGAEAGRWSVSAATPDAQSLLVKAVDGGADGKRVTVLYPRPSPAYDIAIAAILGTFRARLPGSVFHIVNYGNKPDAAQRAAMAAEADGTGLIFAMGSEAIAALVETYRGGKLPVVSVCAKDPVQLGQIAGYAVGSGTNFAFTSLNMPVETQLAYLVRLKPQLRNLAILVDEENTSAVETQAKPLARAAAAKGITVVPAGVRHGASAAAELASLVPDAVAAMRRTDPTLDQSLFFLTGSTALFGSLDSVIQAARPVPVVSAVPELVQPGTKGAPLSIGVGFESNARVAALYGVTVITGAAAPGALKVGVVIPPDIVLNISQIQAIGLKLPIAVFEQASVVFDAKGQRVASRDGTAPP